MSGSGTSPLFRLSQNLRLQMKGSLLRQEEGEDHECAFRVVPVDLERTRDFEQNRRMMPRQ